MKHLLLVIFIANFFTAFSQDSFVKAFLENTTHKSFKQLSADSDYSFVAVSKDVLVVPFVGRDGDTSGPAYRNEFVLSDTAISIPRPSDRFICATPVSNAEFREFKEYIRDSMARERVYSCIEDDRKAMRFLKLSPKDNYDPSDRDGNRRRYPLNYKEDLSYDERNRFYPIIASLYIQRQEEVYRVREFDDRKLRYGYSLLWGTSKRLTFEVPMLSDRYLWALQSSFPQDEAYVLAQGYEFFDVFAERPQIGLNGDQAAAFCNWKQQQLQKMADEKKLHVEVIVSLPMKKDLDQLSGTPLDLLILGCDHTDDWKITNEEYRDFVGYVTDSLLKEYYYSGVALDKPALSLLDYQMDYFDEGGMEYVMLNPADRKMNRYQFPFRKAPLSQSQHELALQLKGYSGDESFRYSFVYRDLKAMAANGPYTADLSRFTREQEVEVTENPAGTDSDAAAISYEQALAYYHWKFNVNLAPPDADWKRFILPSKEQFEKCQHGEEMQVAAHTVPLPGNVFRYVVHVYAIEN